MAINKRWLVQSRSRIQARLLHLDEFGSAHAKDLLCQRTLWAIHGSLIGVAFSLWRAVFLIHTERDLVAEIEAAKFIIDELVETNAINFPQDRKAAQWSAGYYVNNATMRLYFLAQNGLTRRLLRFETKRVLELFKPDTTMAVELTGNELASTWDRALRGFDEVSKDLASVMKKAKRGRG